VSGGLEMEFEEESILYKSPEGKLYWKTYYSFRDTTMKDSERIERMRKGEPLESVGTRRHVKKQQKPTN
jgi:hypothetical protein